MRRHPHGDAPHAYGRVFRLVAAKLIVLSLVWRQCQSRRDHHHAGILRYLGTHRRNLAYLLMRFTIEARHFHFRLRRRHTILFTHWI